MLFNSKEFYVFIIAFMGVYYAFGFRWKAALILVTSYYFYASWKPLYLLLLISSTLVDFIISKKIYKNRGNPRSKHLLYASLAMNFGLLGIFKYGNFLIENLNDLFSTLGLYLDFQNYNVALPIGLSFYTFQTVSYTVDVYRGKIKPERRFGDFALYVSFFPQLVAGPIERANDLIPQLKKKFTFNYLYFREGILFILWGLFKKIVIADRLAEYVNVVFSDPSQYGAIPSIISTIFFSIQIYCDFSGYSDIAVGISFLLGIRLTQNFRRPYLSKSIPELIGRWHISLQNWFKDYIFIPLGGSKKGTIKAIRNLYIVWFFTGLWHGANWTFVLTALLFCTMIILGFITLKVRRLMFPKRIFIIQITEVLFTFLISSVAMVFFRSSSIQDGITLISNYFNINANMSYNLFLFPSEMKIVIFAIVILLTTEILQEKFGSWNLFYRYFPRGMRYISVLALIISLILFGRSDVEQFIYYQF